MGPEEQMVVVLHQDIGMDLYAETGRCPAEDAQKLPIILLPLEDLSLFISSGEDMIVFIGVV